MLDVNSRGNCNVKNLFTHWVIIIINVIGKCKYQLNVNVKQWLVAKVILVMEG